MTQEIIPAYSTFQKDIDLTLYHAFAELVVQTAQDGEARILYRQLEARQIWQEDQNVSSYFEAYSLRYPGEVLERFEEKLGTDIRILRALALALGYISSVFLLDDSKLSHSFATEKDDKKSRQVLSENILQSLRQSVVFCLAALEFLVWLNLITHGIFCPVHFRAHFS